MRRLLLITSLGAVAALAGATAGGGITNGVHTFVAGFSNYELQAAAYRGFGYGANRRGTRTGGFRLAIADQVDTEKLAGSFGGNLTGQELVLGPPTLAITSWTRSDGIAATGIPGSGDYFALFDELDLEIGLAVLPWMQIVGFAGFQVVASILPGFLLSEAISYTPTLGLRLVWGDFR